VMRLPARWSLPADARALRLLVLAVSDRCDQTCLHCQIWQGEGRAHSLTLDERMKIVEDALASGLREALLTGGEPLLSPDLWPLAERLKSGGARLMLATNGMLLERYARDVGRLFDEVYVSLDGASFATHDAARGVPSMRRLAAGVAALREAAPWVRKVARCTLHALNIDELQGVVGAAQGIGFDHVSFLPIDVSSTAFGGRPDARSALIPAAEQVSRFRSVVKAMAVGGALGDGFVLESKKKLLRIARHLDATAGRGSFERPPCDAPWWSSVVEADGALRPCFFHEAVGDARQGLSHLRGGARYRRALGMIRERNATCERCVCPKRLHAGFAWRVR
jgi:MoaA/NifB/PqqE/SkfB family radical SAM enzyme